MKINYKFISILVTFSFLVLFSDCINSHATPTYQGREQTAVWRQSALNRIEKIRKGDLSIEVVDSKGKLLPNAQVKVLMQRHAFSFGSAVSAHDLTSQSNEAHRYRQIVEKNFNKVVFENDLKWGPWETSKQSKPDAFYRKNNTESALKWLNDRGIAVRGHYVVWGHLDSDAEVTKNRALPVQAFRAAVMKHAEEKVQSIGTRVVEWDVVNHPVGWDKKTMMDLFSLNFYDTVFEQVSRWSPNAKRYINEGSILSHNGNKREKYYQLLSEMRARKAKLDGIGFMGHFMGERDLSPPEELLATYDRFAKFGLPLLVTEFDVRFGAEMGKPFPLTPEQEALQADYMRDFLIASFSHPNLEGVIMWGFWEGRHWYPDAALYRKDWSVKPNGKIWEDLVLKQWWTNTTGTSDNKGKFSTRGFLGTYNIEVVHNGKKKVMEKVQLDKSGKNIRIVFE